MDRFDDKKQRPIDRIRDGAAKLEVSTPDDNTPIVEIFSTGDKLLVVKGKGIYEVKLADKIDPERKNINAPNTVQRVIPYGIETPWIGSVILSAKKLIFCDFLSSDINKQKVFLLVLEMSEFISATYQLKENYLSEVKSIIEKNDLKIGSDRSFVLPSLENVESRCHEYILKLDHALVRLFSIAHEFYSDFGKGGWDSLKDKIGEEKDNRDNFYPFLESVIPFLKLIRNTRNCIEHPQENQRLIIDNFVLTSTNILMHPSMQVIHKESPLNKTAIDKFMDDSFKTVINTCELMIAFLCGRKVVPFGNMEVLINELPEENRRYEHVRFGYFIFMNGQWLPIG
jgi:hypothetical protein